MFRVCLCEILQGTASQVARIVLRSRCRHCAAFLAGLGPVKKGGEKGRNTDNHSLRSMLDRDILRK